MPSHDAQMLKGVLTLILLSVLARGDGYGYGIVTAVRAAGFDDVAEGTIYPALARLENAGLLTSYLQRSSSGPARKYYRITEQGRQARAARQRDWGNLTRAVETLTQSPGEDNHETA